MIRLISCRQHLCIFTQLSLKTKHDQKLGTVYDSSYSYVYLFTYLLFYLFIHIALPPNNTYITHKYRKLPGTRYSLRQLHNMVQQIEQYKTNKNKRFRRTADYGTCYKYNFHVLGATTSKTFFTANYYSICKGQI